MYPIFGVQFKIVPQVPQMGYMWGTKSSPSTFKFFQTNCFFLAFKLYLGGLGGKKLILYLLKRMKKDISYVFVYLYLYKYLHLTKY